MGPATIALFRQHGAEVIADSSDLTNLKAEDALIASVGDIDVLIANLAAPANLGMGVIDTHDDA